MPISLYQTFIIEEKHGFNKKTLKIFMTDIILENVLYLVLSPIILYVYLYIMSAGGEYFIFKVFYLLIRIATSILYDFYISYVLYHAELDNAAF